jgi:hypothetical protein
VRTAVGDFLHDVLFLEFVLLEDHVVEGEGQDHGDELQVLLGLLKTAEERLEVVYFGFEEGDLVVEDFLCTVEADCVLGGDGLSEWRWRYLTFDLNPDWM